MAGGLALAMAGIGLPLVEPGIAVSVLVIGVLVVAAVRLPLAPSMLLVGSFAVLPGHSHGPGISGDLLTFSLGFVASTTLLHGAALGLGRLLSGHPPIPHLGPGGGAAGVGLVFRGG